MTVSTILDLFERRGGSQYGREAVTQLEHALQAAALAEEESADAELIVAALLHDMGHLLHDLPDDATERGMDDHHENSAANSLRQLFPARVAETIRLHVAAKRYLCAVDAAYRASLSAPSELSLQVQGGPFSAAEAAEFEMSPHARDAVRLRRWDDAAKDPGKITPPLSHFAKCIHQVAKGE